MIRTETVQIRTDGYWSTPIFMPWNDGDQSVDMASIAHMRFAFSRAQAVRFNLTRGGYLMVTRSTIFLTRKDLAAVDAIDLPTNVNVQAIRRCR